MTWQQVMGHPFASKTSSGNGSGIIHMRSFLIGLVLLITGPAYAETACKDQVDAAFAKLREAKSFRLVTTISNAEGMLKMRADYVLPDRMHQTVQLNGQDTPMEMIVIGEKAWSNQGGGWAELPKEFANKVAEQIKETVAEAPKVATDYKCVGDASFEGKTYALYQGVLPMPLSAESKDKGPRISAVSAPNQQSIYIDKQSGLPARNIVTPVTDPNKRLFDGTFTIVHDLTIAPPTVSGN
ncbi:MAG: hypothetical protein QM780_10875 [Hyphomicrobium sp.]|uniref:hypothetical protein n=1 Tax=Hyphomicrobium sp. TaxID=82 RepID=UPI0039E659DF